MTATQKKATPERPESISSTQMGPSKQLADVIALGKKIEQELGIEDDVDTLGRWMIHYIAELVDRAEKASGDQQETIRRECAEFIIKLWTHRASLSVRRYPLESFDKIMAALIRLRDERPYYFRGINKEDKQKTSDNVQHWLKIAEEIDKIACDLVELCIEKAIGCAAEDEKKWLGETLALSVKADKHAEMVTILLSHYKGDEVGNMEHNHTNKEKLIKTFKEFDKLCLQFVER
jgi:hypothetical protein